jgi:hypothetical protein
MEVSRRTATPVQVEVLFGRPDVGQILSDDILFGPADKIDTAILELCNRLGIRADGTTDAEGN